MRILFSTLFPRDCGRLNEDRNAVKMLGECVAQFPEVAVDAIVGSADAGVLETMGATIAELGIPAEKAYVPFDMRPEYNERRGHEIALGKRVLAEAYLQRQYDCLLFVDSDLYIPFADIMAAIRKLMVTPLHFLSFPYVIRQGDYVHPPQQLGAYIHSKQLGDAAQYARFVDRKTVVGDRVHRDGAPDCNIRARLLECGGCVVRVKDCLTRHYNARDSFRQYDRGRLSGHKDLEHRIGFNPVTGSMPIDAASCIAIHDICKQRGFRKALELGCGLLNGSQALLNGGITHLTTVDESQEYVDYARTVLCPRYGNKSVTVRKVMKRGRAYDLKAFGSEAFDMVLVDGPAKESIGRAESALQVKAPFFLFHDADRDREAIQWFASQRQARVRYVAVGRALAAVELSGARA